MQMPRSILATTFLALSASLALAAAGPAAAKSKVHATKSLAKVAAVAAAAPVEKGSAPAARAVRLVCIDAGHGGAVEGATGWAGLKEKDVALDVALRTGRALEAAGYAVVYTRDADVDVDLYERPVIANRAGADLFVSIHANAEAGHTAAGFETFYLSSDASDKTARKLAARENAAAAAAAGAPGLASGALGLILADLAVAEARADSAHLATAVQFQLADVLDTDNRGVKQAPLAVLAGATMAAVLVEVGFITSKTEGRLLALPKYRDTIAAAIARGVVRYDEMTSPRLEGA
ncbi:MAG TPA: N-acetylmuramoyl-L-alanine amidase, partial [Myxococcota bacterium]|nr:N-acetylmuramoyl-L-alanine amidase [Myxococcota bacterium]